LGAKGEEIMVENSQFFWGKKQKEETSGDDDAIGFWGYKLHPINSFIHSFTHSLTYPLNNLVGNNLQLKRSCQAALPQKKRHKIIFTPNIFEIPFFGHKSTKQKRGGGGGRGVHT